MNVKELLEIERQAKEEINDRNKVPYNQFAEYCLDFIAEVRKLKEEKNDMMRDGTCVGCNEVIIENDSLREQVQLYKDLYTKENTQNMVYKVALEDIEQCNGIIDIYDAKKRAFIALEVKHD